MIVKHGLKQRYVAKEIGITPNYLSAILNGRKNMNADIAIRATKLFGEYRFITGN
ncbi:helix-turn-helix domain-containing protein [Lactobacillus alvi]|uniref:Helix-turn-helix domain-containing protein n=1 Tax=Limosilactobacillus alvi TaxID=990412 RepID=A0ABS2EPL5_9LACO|nr:helix-turn-helix domain-containing protein [Limosilactobacillus alvi]MBM6754437.1 helix-turn-helix domain-containing protein [Limosilactobacillus alvi]